MAALYKISCGQQTENTVLTQCRQSETTLFSFQSLQGTLSGGKMALTILM